MSEGSPPGPETIRRVVSAALQEDIGDGDRTTEAVVPPDARATGRLLAKDSLVLAGLPVALAAFRLLDPGVSWDGSADEGVGVPAGSTIGVLSGTGRGLLTAERVALNFLQRLSGIATLTRQFVEEVGGTGARIRDTRKTTPLLRLFEKHAVRIGGGLPHRLGLAAGILVKDNHVRLAGSVREATRRAVGQGHGLPVEVEVEHCDQIEEALDAGAHVILLDNFSIEAVREAVALVAGRLPVEVSGRVRLANVRQYALAGPDYIAVGALTHSAPAVDISLEVEPA